MVRTSRVHACLAWPGRWMYNTLKCFRDSKIWNLTILARGHLNLYIDPVQKGIILECLRQVLGWTITWKTTLGWLYYKCDTYDMIVAAEPWIYWRHLVCCSNFNTIHFDQNNMHRNQTKLNSDRFTFAKPLVRSTVAVGRRLVLKEKPQNDSWTNTTSLHLKRYSGIFMKVQTYFIIFIDITSNY